jgi:dTDP-4-amino-4,6-dideoxygalactose transaminase
LESAILDYLKKGQKPKAIIVVDLYGMPAQLDEILALAAQYEIPVIEDAAESLGSLYKGRHCGTFGDYSALSFNGNKIITTSGGGALVCATPEQAEQVRFLATQARDKAPHYQHSQIGYNYRMSNISAGIGRGQLEVLHERIANRRKNNAYYKKILQNLPGITLHEEPNADFYSNHWLSCIVVDPNLTGGVDRETIRLRLWKHQIESRPLWKPMHLQPVFADCPYYGEQVAEKLFETGLCLPSGSNLKPAELDEIGQIILTLASK